MKTSRLRVIAMMLVVLALVIAACGPEATEEPTQEPTAEPTTAEVVEETEEAEDMEATEEATEDMADMDDDEDDEDMEATEEATEDMADMDDDEDMEATEEATEETTDDLVDVAVASEDFNVLVAAVQEAELEDTLRDGEFTVFAPTDEAFEALLEELDATQEELLAREDLADILTYHVVEGTVTSDMLEAGEVTTVNGATVTINLEDGVMVNDATVVTADVEASNGVIHVIDSVLLPPAEDMEATPEATEDMTDMDDDEDMEATPEATEDMGDMGDDEDMDTEDTEDTGDMEMGEATLYDGTFDFEYPDNYELRESGTVDTVTLNADSQQVMVVGPDSYNRVIGGETFESDAEALAFYLERRGYMVGDETDMMMGLASYDVTLPRRGLVGAATLVDLNNDRRTVVIEMADTEENIPGEAGAMVMETITYIDLVDTAINADGFDVLVAAVQEAELEDTLRSGEFTVFAPTDDAFGALLDELGVTQEELLEREDLADILTYHVVEGTVTSDAVLELDGETVTTVQGATLTVGVTEEGGVTLTDGMENTVNVVQTDIEAANGVIHVIDSVLLPPPPEPEATPEATEEMADMEATEEATAEATEAAADTEDEADMDDEDMDTEDTMEAEGATIVRLASETPELNTLGTLVIRAGLFGALSDTDAELTVFAPTNDAFNATLDELGITVDDLVADRDMLRNILLYHVVEGEVTSDMLEAGEVTTLNGATVTISLEDGVMVNDATVVTADVQASNGVVHVIDGVLLPPSGDDAEATEETEDSEGDE